MCKRGPKGYSAKKIVELLRAVEVAQGEVKTVKEAIIEHGITEQTFYRWHRQYGSMQADANNQPWTDGASFGTASPPRSDVKSAFWRPLRDQAVFHTLKAHSIICCQEALRSEETRLHRLKTEYLFRWGL